jgi:hypothetical protein
MAWKAVDSDQHLFFSHFDGNGWAPPRVMVGETSSGLSLTQY